MDKHREEYIAELEEMGLEYSDETQKLDPWRGIYNYSKAEYRSSDGCIVREKYARKV